MGEFGEARSGSEAEDDGGANDAAGGRVYRSLVAALAERGPTRSAVACTVSCRHGCGAWPDAASGRVYKRALQGYGVTGVAVTRLRGYGGYGGYGDSAFYCCEPRHPIDRRSW